MHSAENQYGEPIIFPVGFGVGNMLKRRDFRWITRRPRAAGTFFTDWEYDREVRHTYRNRSRNFFNRLQEGARNMANGLLSNTYNPDVLSCLANLSSDEVFTPPEIVNQMLVTTGRYLRDKNATFLDPACKSGVFLREIAKRLIKGLVEEILIFSSASIIYFRGSFTV